MKYHLRTLSVPIGRRLNNLIILSDLNNDKYGTRWVLAECVCGSIKSYRFHQINSNKTRSCGCLKSEITRATIRKKNGGLTRDWPREYSAWSSIKARCCNSQHRIFARYGGRGIIMCDRWIYSFWNFLTDMGKRPTNQHSVDRIDNNGNYCKENCRWVTQEENLLNTRNTIMVEFNCKKQPLQHSGRPWGSVFYR